MSYNLIEVAGGKIQPEDISIPKASEFLQAILQSPFAKLIDILKDENSNEIIVAEVENQVPQFPIHDIRPKEVVAVSFFKDDKNIPKVNTLRNAFPSLPHQNLEEKEKPRSLCLYNLPYGEIKLFWTGIIFLERIREWFKLSALGILHQDDQPLEPLLAFDSGILMLDIPFLSEEFSIYLRHEDENKRVYLLATQKNLPIKGNLFPAVIDHIVGAPQLHGIIKCSPGNLLALAEFLEDAGINLFEYLTKKLLEYKEANKSLSNRLLLFIELQKLRTPESEEITFERFVFLTHQTLEKIGDNLNLWSDQGTTLGLGLIIGEEPNKNLLKKIPIDILRPVFSFDSHISKIMNGINGKADKKLLAIGAGALGSQILNNLIRSGIGIWKVIDSDILLPHNLARHSLLGFDVMKPKVNGVALHANSILPGSMTPIVGDLIEDFHRPDIQEAIKESEFILDMSASSAVMRTLCEFKERNKIISCFLNPSGDSFIIIAEDSKLECSSMFLEGLYLRLILNETELHNHYNQDFQPFRYANGCRDVSTVLPQDSIALAAAIGSKFIKQIFESDEPAVIVWKTEPETLNIKRFSAEIYKPQYFSNEKWTVVYDEYLINKINNIRKLKLPNETGGILVGNYDMQRRVINVLELISSPEDSHEYPTAYIRGIKNVEEQLNQIKKITASGLQYIGEWHTHPTGYAPDMSSDDKILFSWMIENMNKEGLPALMLIVGEGYSFYCS